MPRTLTFDKAFRAFNRALSSGGTRIGVTCAEIDYSRRCASPVTVEVTGRRETFILKRHVVQPRWSDPTTWESVSVIMHCKCRKCEPCLKSKRISWYHRARFETSVAPRTWFGTLTYSPDAIMQNTIMAERRCASRGLDWQAMLDDMKFRHLLYICGRDVALAMKRLRKSARGHIRFLLVSERHKSGVPHFHMLVHERVPNAVTHRLLKDAWRQGFSDFKLADPVSPGYVAKYISKDATALVRASLHYGESSAFSVRLAAPNPSLTEGSGGVSREKLSLGK